jgi:hypothetical protein
MSNAKYYTPDGNLVDKNKVDLNLDIIFALSIQEELEKINTFKAGVLSTKVIEAYHALREIYMFENICKGFVTLSDYIKAKDIKTDWDNLCREVLGRTYTKEQMKEQALAYFEKKYITEQGGLIYEYKYNSIESRGC